MKRSNEQDALIPGVLRLIDKGTDSLLDWSPVDEDGDTVQMLCAKKDSNSVVELQKACPPCPVEVHDPGFEPDWAVVNSVRRKRIPLATDPPQSRRSKWSFCFSLSDLKSIRKNKPGLGWSYLIFIIRDGTSFPALHFHHGGSRALLTALRRYVALTSSLTDPRLFLVQCHDTAALSQSMDELKLFNDTSSHFKFIRDPYTTTMGGFSRVTTFFRDTLGPPAEIPRRRPAAEVADPLHEAIPGINISEEQEPGFELITCTELGPRPTVTRGDPLSQEEWEGYMDSAGQLQRIDELKADIHRGGLSNSLRKDAWKFLLGYFPWDSTLEERRTVIKKKADEYFRMKLQWKSVSEQQEKRNSHLRDCRSLIEKDVNRTDRTNKFYEGVNNPGLSLLHDILMTYCMYDFDLGYVQGMSDLLSPVLYVQESEVDAFWCFVGFMELRTNFEENQQGMKQQLEQLSTLLHLLDPAFCDYLEAHDSGNLYFCFRWLIIHFKREFCFPDILRMWEVMWTGLPCPGYHLLLCCAILDAERDVMIDGKFGFNEILKHVNELSMKLDVEDILRRADAIALQLADCKELPMAVQEILGQTRSPPASLSPTERSPSPSSITTPPDLTAYIADSSLEMLQDEEAIN
uniref:TBC1 domain family member 15 n=1 Tax=Eptatretus burgeri TaxID=7764 RepID=A0A8C4QT28_EPTBU